MSVTTRDYFEALNTINDYLDGGCEGYETKEMKSLIMKLVKETKDIGIQYRDGEIKKVSKICSSGIVMGRHWTNGDNVCPCCGEDKFKNLDADIWADWQPKYCPNCGAEMWEDKE